MDVAGLQKHLDVCREAPEHLNRCLMSSSTRQIGRVNGSEGSGVMTRFGSQLFVTLTSPS